MFNCILLSINAKIEYDINKYGVMFVHFIYNDSIPTIDMLKQDWEYAFDIACTNKKVKQIQFRDKRENLFFWIEKGWFSDKDIEYDKMINNFTSYDLTDTIYGDSILLYDRIPAKYHSDTYKNGELVSSYVSDWSGGTIDPSTSRYSSGGDTYVTETYVKPAYTKAYWYRPVIGHKTIKKGSPVNSCVYP